MEEDASSSPLGASSPLAATLSNAENSSPTASNLTSATSSPLATVKRHKGKKKHGKTRSPGEWRLRSRDVVYARMI